MIITAGALPYLKAQRGDFYWLNEDDEGWQRAYTSNLIKTYENIIPCLPRDCESILDIGGGMGGIDILLSNHYGTPEIAILDGENDPPNMIVHRETFSNARVARRFLAANGVKNFTPISPLKLIEPRPFDLIISLASWCFHYSPSIYLDFVKACCHKDTVLILDVRTIHRDWLNILDEQFKRTGFLCYQEKYSRYAFKP